MLATLLSPDAFQVAVLLLLVIILLAVLPVWHR
jgi:hypothetical protein